MFKLRKPCSDCPFRRGQGSQFRLRADRLKGIFNGAAFQCHKTIDYDEFEDPDLRQGTHPQQCVGLMVLLDCEGRHNQIMQVAQRLGALDLAKLERGQCYQSFKEALAAHEGREP